LAIPIKYLDLPNNGVDPFSYQLKVNGIPEQGFINGSSGSIDVPPPFDSHNSATTDFWAQYTLAK